MEDWQRQIEGMVQGHHAKISRCITHLDSSPDAETLRDMEHVFKELPPTDDLKESVAATKASAKKWDSFINALIANAGKLAFIAMMLGLAAWLNGGITWKW